MPTTSKLFFDTNILLYAIDGSDKSKQKICQNLLARAEEERNGVLSTQVLQEYFVIATRKFGLDPLIVKESLGALEVHDIVVLSPALIHGAVECHVISRISFWDAMVVVAAEAALCSVIYTENLNSGQKIRGMRIENPFK